MDIGWSELPNDLVDLIGNILVSSIGDYVRFRATCKKWFSATPDVRCRRDVPPQIPWHYNYYFSSKADDEHEGGGTIMSRDNGWLVIKQLASTRHYMWNPLSRRVFNLPDFPKRSGGDVRVNCIVSGRRENVTLSSFRSLRRLAMSTSDPFDGRCILVAIVCSPSCLLSLRHGDADWNMVDGRLYHDVLYSNGSFLAVDGGRRMVIFKGESALQKVDMLGQVQPSIIPNSWWCIAEVSGKLYVMRKIHRKEPPTRLVGDLLADRYDTLYFMEGLEVYSFDMEREPVFEVVKSLKDYILYLEQNGAIMVPVKHHRHQRGNTIHCLMYRFIRDDLTVCSSFGGVYTFGDEVPKDKSILREGIWFVPKFQPI